MSAQTVTRQCRTRGGVSWVAEVSIDIDAIAHELGGKAIHSKARKSRALRGAIVVKVHSIEGMPT